MLNRTPGTGEGGKDERGGRRKPGRAQAPGMLPASLPEPHGHAAGHGLPRQSARPVPGCPHRGASKRAVRGREQARGGGGRQPALGLGAHADGRTDRWMDGAAQHARGKARVRHGTNLRAGLSGAGAGSSLERSAAGERTRRDVTPPGARRPLLPSSSAPRAPRLAALPLPCQLAPEGQVPVPPLAARGARGRVLLASPRGPGSTGGMCGRGGPYLRWGRRSSSPHRRRRRPPAFRCSSPRSAGGNWVRGCCPPSRLPPAPARLLTHLVDAPEEGEEAAEQGCAHAGDVDEGALRGHNKGGSVWCPHPARHLPRPRAVPSPPCPGACRCPGRTSARSPWPRRS